MNFDLFVDEVLGKRIDVDGFPEGQPYQCVDLTKYFINKYYNFNVLCTTSGFAKDWFNNRKTNGLLNHFTETAVDNMIKGTLVIFGDCKQAPQSHICFFIEDNGNGTFKALGQNQGHAYVTINNLRYDGIIGALIPNELLNKKSDDNTTSNEKESNLYQCIGDMYVRYNAGIRYPIKLVKNLSEDGKKHATSQNPNAYAVYKAGTVFTARKLINTIEGGIWAETPSGYVCIKGSSGTVYCNKV